MTHATDSTSPLTRDFRHELETETAARLRTRMQWFIAGWGAARALYLLLVWRQTLGGMEGSAGQAADSHSLLARTALTAMGTLVWGSLYTWGGITVWRRRPSREGLLRLSHWLVVVDGVLFALDARFGVDAAWPAWIGILLVHVVACSLLPWKPSHALLAIGSILAVYAVVILTAPGPSSGALGRILALPLLALPGTLIAMVGHSLFLKRFRFRHLSTRYHQIRRELVDARRIHESFFPAPIREGPVRLAYLYEPMRQIGGDFLFAHQPPPADARPPPLSVVLLDVTGHGIAAALTVNRLHGELERVFAERPDVPPGEVAKLLNRYVHLTLARHSIYATALCLRVDPYAHIVEYANAGHPPAFLRAVNGNIEELGSTALVLGAVDGDDFRPDPRTLPFLPGDTIIAYTDGAIEARGANGRLFGLDSIRRLLAAGPAAPDIDWPDHLLHAISAFREGPPADDTVIIELRHALETAPLGRNERKAPAGAA